MRNEKALDLILCAAIAIGLALALVEWWV